MWGLGGVFCVVYGYLSVLIVIADDGLRLVGWSNLSTPHF